MLRPIPNAEAFIACVEAARDLRARGTLERRVVTGRRINAFELVLQRRGLRMDEGADYMRLVRKGFSASEAAEIIIRGRKAQPGGAA